LSSILFERLTEPETRPLSTTSMRTSWALTKTLREEGVGSQPVFAEVHRQLPFRRAAPKGRVARKYGVNIVQSHSSRWSGSCGQARRQTSRRGGYDSHVQPLRRLLDARRAGLTIAVCASDDATRARSYPGMMSQRGQLAKLRCSPTESSCR
jgi:hypothetical protein